MANDENKVSKIAVTIAVFVVFFLYAMGTAILMPMFGVPYHQKDFPVEDFSNTIVAPTERNHVVLVLLAIGAITTMIGGYIAARIARKNIYLNAGAVGAIGVIMGILGRGNNPAWFDMIGLVTIIPAALLGGLLAEKHKSNEQNKDTATEEKDQPYV